jgi:hypothetical protein
MDKKYGDKGCIDIKAMYLAEKKKREQTKKIMQVTKETVFNLLQDMRHLLVLDVRDPEEYKLNRIRDSFNFPLEAAQDNISDFLSFCKKSQDVMLDKRDDLRRLLIITQEGSGNIDEIRPILSDTQAFQKTMQMKDSFSDFEQKYPFLCINDDSSDNDVKRAQARYPSEIIPDKLFLGNFINSLNETHFKNLNIKKVIGMTPNKAEGLGEQIEKYVHLEMNELQKPELDFEELAKLVETTIEEDDGAVLIY